MCNSLLIYTVSVLWLIICKQTGDDPDTPGPIDEQTIRSLFGGDLESKVDLYLVN